MKSKLKYLSIIAISTVMLFGLVGCASNKVSGNVKSVNTGSDIQSNQTEFNTEMSVFEKMVENTSTSITDDQITTINTFENNYLYPVNNSSENIQNKNQLISYLESKMTEGLTSNNTNYINNFIDATNLFSSSSTDKGINEIYNLRTQLIAKNDAPTSASVIAPTPIVPSTPIAPTIGMTVLQVETSTWGDPQSKNISQNAYGTTEQWCYPNYQYIYFDNGIVTSIQSTN